MIALDAHKFAGNQIQCTLPRHRDERLAAATLAVPAAVFQPAIAHHRLRDASLRMHRPRYRLDHGRGIGVVFEGPHADDATVLHLREKSAPMGMVANELGHGSGLRLHRVSPRIRAGFGTSRRQSRIKLGPLSTVVDADRGDAMSPYSTKLPCRRPDQSPKLGVERTQRGHAAMAEFAE